MRKVLVLVLVLAGCATIHVPNTPEGGQCRRECLAINNQCIAAGGNLGCIGQHRNCLRTCPGAWED
jgi:hypothetical protein